MNCKRIFFLLALCCVNFYALSQTTCTPIFQKAYGGNGDDEALSIAYGAGGGMIVAGRSTSNSAGQYDGMLMYLSDAGVPIWTRITGGTSNDKLVMVKQLTDGGFIALGETRSFSNSQGEPWVIRMSNAGNVLWSKRYGANSGLKENPKDIIQLSNGEIVFAFNLRDSTIQSDAVIVKLSATGDVVWSIRLDQGSNDGVNAIAEYNDTLLVAGYATVDQKDAIITKLFKTNGSFISAEKFTGIGGYHEEALGIERTDAGIAFSVWLYPTSYDGSFYPSWVSHYKMSDAGKIFYERKQRTSTASATRLESVDVRATADGGVITLVNDTTSGSYAQAIKLGADGFLEWGRNLNWGVFRGRTFGMDIASDHGYVFAGYKSGNFSVNFKNKVRVIKTTRLGKTGNCTLELALNFVDTGNYVRSPFTWNILAPVLLTATNNSMTVSAINFNMYESCEDVFCDSVQLGSTACNASMLGEIRGEQLFDPSAATKCSDGGYAVAGVYGYYYNQGPAIYKLNPAGAVEWAKTYNDHIHNGHFTRIARTKDSALLVVGYDNYVINHSSIDSMFLMKISNSGDVIWAKKYSRYGSEANDISFLADGSFIVTINESYGSGSPELLMVRFNAQGNFIWKKELFGLNSVLRAVFTDANAVYAALDPYTNYGDAPIEVVKLDLSTGDLIWSKSYRSKRTESLFINSLEKIGDTLFVGLNIYTPLPFYQYKGNAGFIKLDPTSGDVVSTPFRITNINQVMAEHAMGGGGEYRSRNITSNGTDLFVANQVRSGGDTSIFLTRLDANGQVLWSKKYSNLRKQELLWAKYEDFGLTIAGRRNINIDDNRNIRQTIFMRSDDNGNVAVAGTGFCENTFYNAVTDTFTVMPWYARIDSVKTLHETPFYGYFGLRSYIPATRDIWGAASTMFCNTPSVCNTINIIGPSTICNIADTITYTIQKNAGCSAGVIWDADTSMVTITSVSDNELKVVYKKDGTTVIKATIISGCAGLTTVYTVTIPKAAATLNLGSDTILCSGNNYVLNAGEGFSSYEWLPAHQGNSYIVTQPGTYSVKVTDQCNNTFNDTVIISPASFSFSAGNDTSKCNADTVVLTAPSGFSNYQWQPTYNSVQVGAQLKVFPVISTDYYVAAEKWPGCIVKDTIHITVNTSPQFSLGADTSICYGDTVNLSVSGAFTNYYWSNGANTNSIIVTDVGSYSVVATASNGCNSRDTFELQSLYPLPQPRLGNDTSICLNTSFMATPGSFSSYRWHNGSVQSNFIVDTPGIYHVVVTNAQGCSAADTMKMLQLNPLPGQFLPDTLSFCEGGMFELSTVNSYRSYNWSNGATTSSIKSSQPGTYRLKVKDANGCEGEDSARTYYKDCYNLLYFPTAFTPNNDNLNDVFKPKVYGVLMEYRLTVYSRYGDRIFESNDFEKGWNGTIQGLPQPAGTYVWISTYRFIGNNRKQESAKGTIVLIR